MPDPDPQNPPPTCASCGTDISGLSREDRCPNCGVKIAHLGDMPVPERPALIPLHAPDGDTIERELNPPTCPRCKYERVGLARGAPCPECGKVPGVPDNFPVYQPLTQARRIAHAIGCSSCGYNLRGLMSERCPECNEPLILKVGLTEPKLAEWMVGLVGVGMSTGFCLIVLLWGTVAHFRRGGVPIDELLPLIVGVCLGAGLLLYWGRFGRRTLSRIGPNGRWPLVVGIVALGVPCILWFFQRVM